MAIIQTVQKSDFRDAFIRMDRKENFSYEGLGMLFDYLDECSEGADIELDVIAICCEYNELDLETINQDYQQEFESIEDAEEWLQEETSVIGATSQDTIVFAVF